MYGDGQFLALLRPVLPQKTVEIQLERVHAVSRADVFLPFSVEDAARSEEEVEASQVLTSKQYTVRKLCVEVLFMLLQLFLCV